MGSVGTGGRWTMGSTSARYQPGAGAHHGQTHRGRDAYPRWQLGRRLGSRGHAAFARIQAALHTGRSCDGGLSAVSDTGPLTCGDGVGGRRRATWTAVSSGRKSPPTCPRRRSGPSGISGQWPGQDRFGNELRVDARRTDWRLRRSW